MKNLPFLNSSEIKPLLYDNSEHEKQIRPVMLNEEITDIDPVLSGFLHVMLKNRQEIIETGQSIV